MVQDQVDPNRRPRTFNGTIRGAPTNILDENPDFLSSPAALDGLVRSMATIAQGSGRYFSSTTVPSAPTTFGDNVTGQGITFVDGDASFTGYGGGIMVVTGQLTLHGNFNFRGLIIVTGPGGVIRRGGGHGEIRGNMIVAPYAGSQIEDGITPTLTQGFLSPYYDLSGGGTSDLLYDSTATANSLIAVSNFVLGVVEK